MQLRKHVYPSQTLYLYRLRGILSRITLKMDLNKIPIKQVRAMGIKKRHPTHYKNQFSVLHIRQTVFTIFGGISHGSAMKNVSDG